MKKHLVSMSVAAMLMLSATTIATAQGVMTTIYEESKRIEDILQSWQSELDSGKDPNQQWKIAKSKLSASIKWISEECLVKEICQEFSKQATKILYRESINVDEVRTNMMLSLRILSLKIEQKKQQEKEYLVWLLFCLSASSLFIASALIWWLMKTKKQIKGLAMRDTLTGLPTLLAFEKALERYIASANRDNLPIFVLCINFNHFKRIKDAYGHGVGNLFLVDVAKKLSQCIRENDILVHLGRDDFAIAITAKNMQALHKLLERIERILAPAITIDSHKIHGSASIGIAVFPDDGEECGDLMRSADLAMGDAKRDWSNMHDTKIPVTHRLYSPKMQKEQKERENKITMLENALTNNWFTMFFQVLVSPDGIIRGAEALVRLIEPNKGIVPPGEWIDLAEKEGLIVPIGRWIIVSVFAQKKKWKQAGIPCGRISINLSVAQLDLDEDVIPFIIDQMEAHDLDREDVLIELTESRRPTENMQRKLEVLAGHVSMMLDDYGTDGATIADLLTMLVVGLKIDKRFTDLLPSDNAPFVMGILALAKSLKLKITAEGVETLAQVEFLAGKVDHLQGYFFAKALPPKEFEALIQELKTWTDSERDEMDFWKEKQKQSLSK